MRPSSPPPHYLAYRITLVTALLVAVACGAWWSVENDLLAILDALLDRVNL